MHGNEFRPPGVCLAKRVDGGATATAPFVGLMEYAAMLVCDGEPSKTCWSTHHTRAYMLRIMQRGINTQKCAARFASILYSITHSQPLTQHIIHYVAEKLRMRVVVVRVVYCAFNLFCEPVSSANMLPSVHVVNVFCLLLCIMCMELLENACMEFFVTVDRHQILLIFSV